MSQPTARRLAWLVVLACLVSGRAFAQGLEFPVDNLRLAASPRGYYVTDSGQVLGHLQPSAQILGNYSGRPLQLVDTETNERASELIKSRLDLDLLLAIGFFDVLELGVVLPFTVSQNGDEVAVLDRPVGDTLSGGLRDLRILPKVRFIRTKDDVAAVTLGLPLSVPTGNQENLLGESGVTFSPELIFSIDTTYFDIALNAGYRIRRDQSFAFSAAQPKVVVGSEIFGSVGTRIALGTEHVELMGDFFLSTPLSEQDTEEVPIETLGGLRFHFAHGFIANAGAGAGLTRGLGAPEFRILAGFGYAYEEDPDPDEDGILGDADACPLVPEDFDNFQDPDGCPEPDNDNDGVLDPSDKCPLVPEDRDGFEDDDGCPDPDNDKDGIADVNDSCPNDPEDVDNFEDADGCPEPDNDKDGILDGADVCPLQPEDIDTFEDENGCPDPDNDQDNILDTVDKCPLEAEDVDNFEDTDGCPDPDNDQDGILDPVDKCPLQPETINGFEDQDGCPDKAKGPVQIEHGKITTPPVFFATNKDVILSQSFPILEQVANTFRDNPWVKRVRIEGHTDDRGNDDFNMDLSARRAASVQRFLIERGVEPERLETAGYGETRPVASNKTKKGRAKNRRVEFIILDPPQSQNPTSP